MWYDMIYDTICYDIIYMIWYISYIRENCSSTLPNMIYDMIWYTIRYMLWYYIYDMIYDI